MKKTLRLAAPAKINLFLEVLRRRPDGYHTLSTLFQEISLADELTVSADPGGAPGECRLRCPGGGVSAGSDNLVSRAARAFAERFGGGAYGAVLRKRTPVGAGLGGGSSDAAAMLKACWALKTGKPLADIPRRSLAPLARDLGADVAFFLKGGLAEAGGIGEVLRPLRRKGPRLWFVLVFPRVFVATKDVYRRLRFPLTKARSNHKLKEALLRGAPAKEWAPHLYNRLEEAVLPRVRAVRDAKKALTGAGCLAALMSGSGSSVFGVVESEAAGRRVISSLRGKAWDKWLVHSP